LVLFFGGFVDRCETKEGKEKVNFSFSLWSNTLQKKKLMGKARPASVFIPHPLSFVIYLLIFV
jgi:hypothetical protein